MERDSQLCVLKHTTSIAHTEMRLATTGLAEGTDLISAIFQDNGNRTNGPAHAGNPDFLNPEMNKMATFPNILKG